MPGNLTFDALKKAVSDGEIDTVLAAQIDMQGRLMGKRFQAHYFAETAWQETHSCNYLLATDLEMETVSGYRATNWESGYGDYIMKPDLTTLRRVPWLDGTAFVLCDVMDHSTHEEVPHAPRTLLKRQQQRLQGLGMKAMMGSELELFLFDQSFEDAHASGYRGLSTFGKYNADYHIFQTTKEEHVMRAIRNGLYGAGVKVECSKGEASAGQEELNIRYSDSLDMADTQAFIKNGCKEIAWAQGRALTFLAKWHRDAAGNSCHIHQSLWSADGETPLFHDAAGPYGMSPLMRHYLAGLLHHASDITWFLAPYVNSYKRFVEGTFAPTRAVWSRDNRTAGFRLCGEDTGAVRVECRVGGSDLNPHLAMAALIAAGLDGIEKERALEPEFRGDAYKAGDARAVPRTLREAIGLLDNSEMLRKAMGDEVIDHYVHAAGWEQEVFDRQVTDWEVARGFERA